MLLGSAWGEVVGQWGFGRVEMYHANVFQARLRREGNVLTKYSVIKERIFWFIRNNFHPTALRYGRRYRISLTGGRSVSTVFLAVALKLHPLAFDAKYNPPSE